MTSASELLASLKTDFKSLARSLSYVENDLPEGRSLLSRLEIDPQVPVIGVTGAPGAGKSTLIDALAGNLVAAGKRLAILAVDPTSPFNFGSLLADRIRMGGHFLNGQVFIRSLATRGSLGGLSAKTFELTDVLRASAFDLIFIETVGVGQSEVEIAGLADRTLVVMAPGNGDEIQMIKSGIMEIADAFIVNKCDRDGADQVVSSIQKFLHDKQDPVPVLKTSPVIGEGIADVVKYLLTPVEGGSFRKSLLLAEKAWKLVEAKRMSTVNKEEFRATLAAESVLPGFNLYRFAERFA